MKTLLASLMLLSFLSALGQGNLLRNPSLEGDVGMADYPRQGEFLGMRAPQEWYDYRNGRLSAWFYDSSWVASSPNDPNPHFQNGYYMNQLCDDHASAFDSLYTQGLIVLSPMQAHSGQYFVGFDAGAGIDHGVEGIQQRMEGGCALNSGHYHLQMYVARAFTGGNLPADTWVNAHLSNNYDDRDWKIDEWMLPSTTVPGQWLLKGTTFQLDYNDPDHRGHRWLLISGGTSIDNTECGKYTFLDDVSLGRPCDQLMRCARAHGQICPIVTTYSAPGDLLVVENIGNAHSMNLRLSTTGGQLVWDTTYNNGNGLPTFRLPRKALSASLAEAYYTYQLTLANICGEANREGLIHIRDTALYPTFIPWRDTTANWSVTPIPCCLSALTLQNMQIVGNVSYIVRDQITVQNGVSIAPGSHVTFQAGQVVEIDSAEFDGTVSSLEIVEVPCPQRCAQGTDCGGGSMVIDAGEFVPPILQAGGDSGLATESALPISSEGQGTTTEPSEALPIGTVEAKPRLVAYPNPFKQQIQVKVILPAEQYCTLQIQDVWLHPVAAICSLPNILQGINLPAGVHQFTIDLPAIPAGIYQIHLQAGATSISHRLVKQ